MEKMDATSLWSFALQLIRAEVSDMAFEAWFGGTQALSLQDGELYVRARDDFQVRMLDERYQSLCQAALRRSYGQPRAAAHALARPEAPAFAQPRPRRPRRSSPAS